MKLQKGHVATRVFTTSGTFAAIDFGANSHMLAWQAINIGVADVTLFVNGLTLSQNAISPLFTMPYGYEDTGRYSFTFDQKGPAKILIVAVIAAE